MILKSINVKNFRSILDETLEFDNLTALLGANGSGKSSFLRALDLFQNEKPALSIYDFYNEDTEKEIIFTVTFTNLSHHAKECFKRYLQKDNLTVKRILKLENGKPIYTYNGEVMQNRDFDDIRNSSATVAKPLYKKLKEDYPELPDWDNHSNIKEELSKWELKNPARCVKTKVEEQFHGYAQVGINYLNKYIKFLYVPAVQDASLDAVEGGKSQLTYLINHVIKKELMQKPSVKKLQEDFKGKHEKVINQETKAGIDALSNSLTKTLKNYAPDARIKLSWIPSDDFPINLPSAIVKLSEDNYSAPVEQTGHGLQRAYIITLLQYLSSISNNDEANLEASLFPTLVFIIEEPELYQHPSRQRHLSKLFMDLSNCNVEEISSEIQVVYSTHSPHFVGPDRIENIRLLRKQTISTLPKTTKIFRTSMYKIASELSRIRTKQYTTCSIASTLRATLIPLINEGFFSKLIVLVEGEADRASLIAASNVLNSNLEGLGISIIPAGGKDNLDKIGLIFKLLEIPTYIIWDNDRDNPDEVSKNHRLLRLLNEDEIDYPTGVHNNYAVIEGKLETMLKRELGDKYEKQFAKSAKKYNLNTCNAEKNIVVIEDALKNIIKADSKIPTTFEAILKKIKFLLEQ